MQLQSIISGRRALLSSSFTWRPLIQERNRLDLDLSRAVSANMVWIRSHSRRLVGAGTDEGQGSVPLLCQSPDIAQSSIQVAHRLKNGLPDDNGPTTHIPTHTLALAFLTPEMSVWTRANKVGWFWPLISAVTSVRTAMSHSPFPRSPPWGKNQPKPFFGLARNVR